MKSIVNAMIGFILGFVALFSANAEFDARTYTIATTNTGVNALAYVIRGDVRSVTVTVPTAATASVVVASTEDTVFSKSGITNGTFTFYPRIAVQNSGGVTLATNEVDRFNVQGVVTTTVTGASSGTNSVTVKVGFSN